MIAIVTSDQFTVGLIAKHRSSFIARTVMIHELPLASAHGTSLPCLGHNMKLIALVEDPALSSFFKTDWKRLHTFTASCPKFEIDYGLKCTTSPAVMPGE